MTAKKMPSHPITVRLKEIRKTRRWLATQTGYSTGYINDICSRYITPGADSRVVREICKALQINLNYYYQVGDYAHGGSLPFVNDQAPGDKPGATIFDLVELQRKIEKAFQLSKGELMSREKPNDIARPRMLFCFIAYQAGFSFGKIARYLERDHSTVIHAVKATEKRLKENDWYLAQVYRALYKKAAVDTKKLKENFDWLKNVA